MESDSQAPSQTLSKQPSGIRALPSNDDDSDSEPVFASENDNNSPKLTPESDGKSSNSIGVSSTTETSSDSSSLSNNGGSDGGKETVQKPVAKVSAEEEDDDDNEVGGDEDEDEVESYRVESPPKARVSGEEDDVGDVNDGKEVQNDEKEVGNEAKVVENEPEVVENEAKVVENEAKVVENELEIEKEVQNESKVEENEAKVEENEPKVVESEAKVEDNEAKVEENGVVDSKEEEKTEGVSEEKDAIVDSINVDVGEAVRSGAAVVGVQNEGSATGPVEEDSVEKPVEIDGAKATDEVVVGDEETVDVVDKVAEKEEDSEVVKSSLGGDDVVDKVAEIDVDVVDKVAVENSSVGEENAGDNGEEDSVVDAIKVDPVEAVRSGVAVVGEEEPKETENVKEDETLVVVAGENVAVGNDFEPLAGSNSSELGAELDNHVEPAEQRGLSDDGAAEEPKNTQSEPEEPKEPEPEPEPKESGEDEKKVEPDVVDNETQGAEDDVVEADDDGDSDNDAYTSQMVEELERASRGVDGEVVTESEEEEEAGSDEEDEGEQKELFDSAALAALLKAATTAGGGSDSGTITITSPDGSRLFSVERPAGLGSSLRAIRPAAAPRSGNSSFLTPPNLAAAPSDENLSDEEKKKLQSIHNLRVKFLRLVHRLGHSPEDSVAAQVLYRLALLAGRPTSPAFSLENAKQTAAQLEEEGRGDDLEFSINILVLGKTGMGKSATVNSIFGEEKVKINTFDPETTSVQVVHGVVNGVKIRVIDAPGLRCSGIEQGFNRKILSSVKKYTKKYPLDVMLYVDRLDSPTRSLNDLPMLKTITACLGSSVWRSAVVALTHASCAPPEGPSGSPLSYDVFVAQRSHIVQQSIGHATGDMRLMNPSLMNPVTLVENHPACRKNREGQKVLPNGQTWRPQLLLLCYSLKILSEANSISKPQDPFDHRKLFGFRSRAPPLPYLLSSLLQPRAHPKLPADQGGDNADSDIDLDDLSDSDEEQEEDEYDQLPPFKPLRKSQLAKLSKEQQRAYFEEYDYRVKLLQKKQWREELRRMRDAKRGGKGPVPGLDEYGEMPEEYDGDGGAPAAVPVPLPDMVLPPTFDGDNPAYRYRFLEPTSQFLARPVLDTHGWDHDCGYDGVNVEQTLGIMGRYPGAISVQVTKDKKDFNIHMDSAFSAKHGDTGSSLVGFDIQTIGKQLAYIVRGETKHKTARRNKTAGGVSVTFLGENVATGVKLEDQVSVGRRLVLVGSAGTVRSQKDAAYGANLEVRLREADYPIGQDQSSVVLSLMKWRGDLALGANLQSQFSVGRGSKMAVRVGLNNKLSGQISVRTSTSDHLQLALAGLIPIALSIYRNLKPSAAENYSLY